MNQPNENDDLFGEVIHAYTRAQAIEDGELIDDNAEPVITIMLPSLE